MSNPNYPQQPNQQPYQPQPIQSSSGYPPPPNYQQNYAPQQSGQNFAPYQQQPQQAPYPGYQQSGPSYPQQPSFQQQQPKKKNRVWLILGVVLVAVVLMCGGFALFSSHTNGNTASTSSTQNAPASSGKSSSASSSSTSSTYKVGQSATSGDWNVTVESATISTGDQLDTPKTGNQYLLIKVSETYTGSSQGNASSLLQFTLRDTNGQSYTETVLANGATTPDGQVAPGAKVAGTLAYEVPTATKNFQLSYEGSLGDTAVIYDIKA